MQQLSLIFDAFVHIDSYLRVIASDHGAWVYLFLFVVVFCETGLVVTPFLPGDSLLFMVGTLAAAGALPLGPAMALIAAAAILGDTANYHIGKYLGPKAFGRESGRFFKKENLEKAAAFYEKYGAIAIILGRFMPIIRTFVPFAAGIGRMRYGRFIAVNALGGVLWASLFCLAGFFFGNIPFVQKNMTPIIYAIIAISLVPALGGAIASRIRRA